MISIGKTEPVASPYWSAATRFLLLGAAVFFVVFFAMSFPAGEAFEPICLPFSLLLPCFAVFQVFVYVDLDRNRIANSFRLGNLWHFEYRLIAWADVDKLAVYHSENRTRLNLRLTTSVSERATFSVPIKSPIADTFVELQQRYSP